MKSITQLLLLVLALMAFAYAEAEPEAASTNWRGNGGGSDWGKAACIKRAPNVQKAIEQYCNYSNGFSIPSVHSGNHKRVGNAVVGITGVCRPAQWLPWDICFKQFYEMCVSGNGRGEQSRVYGKKRCQKWKISNPR